MKGLSRPPWTFRATWLRLVFLPGFFLLCGMLGTTWFLLDQAQAMGQKLNSQIVSGLAAQVGDELKARTQLLDQWARVMEVVTPERRPEVFDRLAGHQSTFETLYLLDPGSLVLGEWPRGQHQVGNDFSGLKTLQRWGAENDVAWSDATFSSFTEKPTVSVFRAFEGGIIMGNLDLGLLSRLVTQLAGTSGTTVLLVDAHGTYLAHPDPVQVQQRVSDQSYLSQREKNPAVRQYGDQKESGVFQVSVQPLPGTGWTVLVSQSLADLSRPVVSVFFLLIPLAVMFVLGTLVLVRLTDQRLRGALGILKRQTESLGRGEFGGGEVRTPFQDLNAILDSFDEVRQNIWLREQDLRMGELRFRRMFEDAAVGIFHSTYTGELLDLNQAMAELLGYANPGDAKTALGGTTVGLYVRPEEREALIRMLQTTADAKVNVTTEFFHRSGAVLSVNHHLARVFDTKAGQFHLEAFTEDVTELKRAEQAVLDLNQVLEARVGERTRHLARALEDLETAQSHLVQSEKMAALGQLIAGIAHELNTPLAAIHASNDNIATLLQRVLSDLPGFLAALTPELSALHRRLYESAARNIEVVPSAVLRSRRKETLKALADRGLEPEEPMVASLVELGVTSTLDEWLPLLRSPHGATALRLTDEMVSLEKSCSVIASASEKAAKVINALRTFSHQAQESVFDRVNVREGIETVLTLFQSRFKAGVTVRTDLDPKVHVWGLGDKLNQVWTNLVANALQAMGDRGALELVAESQGTTVRISVIDSGPGVPATVQDRIFEPFFTTKKAGEGIGMGLDICRRIVGEHGGKIAFESRPGRTEFYVELPEAR